MQCDLCKQQVGCVNPFDLKDMYWTQRDTIQKVSMNQGLKNYKIDLCGQCRKKIFDTSSLVIPFRTELFEALNRKVCEVKF